MQKLVKRDIQPILEKWLFREKTLILYGARQVGKTTLCKTLLMPFGDGSAYFNCEIQSVRSALSVKEPQALRRFIGDKKNRRAGRGANRARNRADLETDD